MLVLVGPRDFDLAAMEASYQRDEGPRHGYSLLMERPETVFVVPGDWSAERPSLLAKLLGRFYGSPSLWAGGRHLARAFGRDDVIVFPGLDLAVAYAYSSWRRGPRRMLLTVDLNLGATDRALLRSMRRRVAALLLQLPGRSGERPALPQFDGFEVQPFLGVDVGFYSPDPSMATTPGLIVSAGLVDRDYALLADCVDGLDVSIEICAAASVAPAEQLTRFPQSPTVPVQVAAGSVRELRDLYRRCELVVVPLMAASRGGLTVVCEALACGKAVVVSTTNDALRALAAEGLVVGVPAGDRAALRYAIDQLLRDPARRIELGRRGREWAERYVANEVAIGHLADTLHRVAGDVVGTPQLSTEEKD
jgi:glycosyltransferase involved in cell wall biosynthesis